MTYYELVKAIQTLCEDHKQVQSYGYGVLSNIETPLVNSDRRYPYVFLNPTQHTLNEGVARIRFNMIVMDLAHGDFRDVPNDAVCRGPWRLSPFTVKTWSCKPNQTQCKSSLIFYRHFATTYLKQT